MVSQLTTGMARRLGRSSGRRVQLATHWTAYMEYLAALVRGLGAMDLPGLGRVPLESTYVAQRLRPWSEASATANGSPPVALQDILTDHHRVLLVGPAGTGKSALLRWHAVELARQAQHAGRRLLLTDSGGPLLPLYVPLAQAAGDEPLGSILQPLRQAGFEAEAAAEFVSAHLDAGQALLLFDDLDTWSRDDRRSAAQRINQLLADRPDNRVIVATRDMADRDWLPGFQIFEVVGIDPSQIETLAGRWGYGAVANTSGFLQVVERSPLVRSLVSRPGWLAASLAGVAGQPGPIRAFDIVAGFVQHLDPSDPQPWEALALRLHEAGSTVGDAAHVPSDRRGSGLLQWLSATEFRFVHLAVQAFFAAGAAAPADLTARAADPWWEPVIALAAGHLPDPRPLVAGLLSDGHAALAGLVLAECRPMDPTVRGNVVVAILTGMGFADRDTDRQAAISLAGLVGVESVGHTGLVAPALAAMADDDVSVRRAAAFALGRIGDPSAIAPLLTSLGDADAEVRAGAADALAAFGERTVQPLVRQLSVPNENVRQAALLALAQQGERAVPALVPLLEGPSSTGRSEAAEALARIGAPAVPALIRLLKSALHEGTRNDAQVAGAAEALVRIGRPAASALIPVYAEAGPAARPTLLNILLTMGPPAVEALAETATTAQDPFSATGAALLGEMPAAGPTAANALLVALGDSRFEVRWEARRALRRLGAAATDVLVAALDGSDPQLRWEIAQILLELPNPPLAELTQVLAEALGAADVGDRRRAVKALGQLSGPAVQSALVKALDDSDALVRRSAVNQLGLLNDQAAVAPLVARWAVEDDVDTGRAILDNLVELAPKAAVPVLIDALAADRAELNRAAADLLIDVGEPAVVPLIGALNSRPEALDLEDALRVLDRAGAGARPGARTPANLARTYFRMLVEPLDVEELVYLASAIEWWPPALELHRTFDAARQFLEYASLGGIGTAEAALEWVDEVKDWLRPSAPKALRQLRTISQAVQYYNRGATRRSKEKGLLAAADRLNTLRAMVPELGEPHARVFLAVADHWNSLINDAIRELQGQADLDLEIRTEHVRIRDVETAAVLVFELVNRGEGLASNVQLAFLSSSDGLAVESASTHYLPPLGQGDRIATEFTVRRQGAGVVPLTMEVKYDDPQSEGQVKRFAREVRFFVEDAQYRDIGTSPYIAGPPVKTPEMFYGRKSTFSWIQENLSGTYQDNVLVLYGERRTGKTSVLYQLQYHLPDTYAFVLIDLQSIAYGLGSTSDLLYAMARKAINGLRRLGFDLPRPEREDFAEHPIEQFEMLGETIGEMASERHGHAVVMLDEFDLLIEAVETSSVSPYVFDCIRGLMQHQDGLSFIFAGAHKLTRHAEEPALDPVQHGPAAPCQLPGPRGCRAPHPRAGDRRSVVR